MNKNEIKEGYATFIADGTDSFGAVRQVSPGGRPELVIYVENAGDFTVPFEAVQDVHFEKVILHLKLLNPRLRAAIGQAHDAESI